MDDAVEQVVPAGVAVVLVEHGQGVEETVSGGDAVAGLSPPRADPVAHGMEAERDQVQGQQQVGQSVGAVSEVVLHVIAVVFQYVERLVLDLPACPGGVGQRLDVVRGGLDGGDEAVLIGGFPAVLYLHREPVHLQCVSGVADRQRPPAPAVGSGFASGTFLSSGTGDPAVQLQSVEEAVERLMGGGFGSEQEITAGLDDSVADRVMGEKVIGKDDRSQMSVVWQMMFDPAVGGLGLTVLFVIAVLRRDELRTQRHHLVVAVGDQSGTQYRMMIRDGVGFLMVCGGALRTPDPVRVMELRAVQGDEDAVIEPGEVAKCLIFNQFSQCHVERRIQQPAVDVVEFVSDVVVGGNACDTEQRVAGMTVGRLQESALVVQERGTLHEECAESRHRDIGEPELAVVAGTGVGQGLEDGPQLIDQVVDCEIHGLWLYHKPIQSTSPNLLFSCIILFNDGNGGKFSRDDQFKMRIAGISHLLGGCLIQTPKAKESKRCVNHNVIDSLPKHGVNFLKLNSSCLT